MSKMIQTKSTLVLCAALSVNVLALPAADTCSPVELVIARGTREPVSPDYGVVVGDPLYNEVRKIIPQATGYKVEYPASFELHSVIAGRDDVIRHLTEQSKRCPEQKYAMVGYSQGADVMHNAMATIDPALYAKVIALVMFGDPGNKGPQALSPLDCKTVPVFPPELSQKLKQNCEKGDPVCTSDGTATEPHLVYGQAAKGYMAQSATYIQQQLQSGGKSGPQPSPNAGSGNNLSTLLELGASLGASVGAPKGGAQGCAVANANSAPKGV